MTELRHVHSDAAPAAIGPYSQAVAHGGLLYCSGQVALDPSTMELVGGDDVEAQAEQVLANLRQVLIAGGSSFAKVLKTTVFLATMDDFAKVNVIYERHFGDARPARACVAVKTLPKHALVEIDCIASID